VPFSGSPAPAVTWTKAGAPLSPHDHRLTATATTRDASLVTTGATLTDTASYTCTLTNNLGTDKLTFRVTVLDRPGQPQGLSF
jgi:hypothetical protein